MDSSVRAKTILQLLEESIGISFCDYRQNSGFIEMTSKAQATKKNTCLLSS